MAIEVRWRRGTTLAHSTFTGAAGEVTVDSTKNTLVVHDGVTEGGVPLATEENLDEKYGPFNGQLAGMRNKIINGNFQINQRGYVSGANTSTANQYTLDRWRVVSSGGQNVAFSASDNGNQITAPAGGTEQVIEGINIEGGTYVLNWVGTATATVNGTPRTKGETFTLPANTNATVRLIGGTASLVQLETGTVATPFEHRPIGTELALCQRYFFREELNHAFFLNGNAAFGQDYATTCVSLPVSMRAMPTCSFTGSSFMFLNALTSQIIPVNNQMLFWLLRSALAGGFYGQAGSGSFIQASAEL